MTKNCPKCNTELPDTAATCYKCGTAQECVENDFSKKINLDKNQNMERIIQLANYSVYEHKKDLSCDEYYIDAYFAQEMNVRKRQLLISLNGGSTKIQSGAMQWMFGNVTSETGLGSGVGAVGKLIKGAVASMVTKESAIKPIFKGNGYVMLEPTYKHIILENVADWGDEGVVLDDGIFLACDSQLKEKVVARQNFSSAFGGKGIFNICLAGKGIAALECSFPREELIEFTLNNDTLKIDGNMAVMWSKSLDFTVERSSKTLIGSMVNKEGLVNVYKGTGKVLMAPTMSGTLMKEGYNDQKVASKGPLSQYTNALNDIDL